jgi:hypothetical protein
MKFTTVLFLSIFLFSCDDREYNYKIEGQVPTLIERQVDLDEVNITEELRPAIAYTDTIYGQNEDSVWYYNSDGSKVTLLKPYKIYKLK